MKYSEFEKRITERLGYKVENRIDCIDVVKSNYLVGRVNKKHRYNLTLKISGVINDDAACYLAQMCHELACTPLNEREDEKKYRIKHKYLGESLNYLNYDGGIKEFRFHSVFENGDFKTKFTKSELVELLPLNLYGSICDSEIYEWEEVE